MPEALRHYSLKLPQSMFDALENIARKEKRPMADIVKRAIRKSLALEWADDNEALLLSMIRSQVDAVITPHVERLAKISAKAGHAALASMYLNAQAVQDLVPDELSEDATEAITNSRKRAVVDMRSNWDDFAADFLAVRKKDEELETVNQKLSIIRDYLDQRGLLDDLNEYAKIRQAADPDDPLEDDDA